MHAIYNIHKEKIAHRDIKPNNILLNKDGDWVLSDFGVSKPYEL